MSLRKLPETLDECEVISRRLFETISALEKQLNSAKASAASGSGYADSSWFIRTSSALKHKRREYQSLQVHMGALRGAEKRRKNLSFNSVLIEVLKEQVSRAVFDACILEAKHRAERKP